MPGRQTLMRGGHFQSGVVILAVLCLFVGVCFGETSGASPASRFQVIYTFQGTPDAAYPGGLTPDGNGNFYGTAGGGAYGNGSVFELKHTKDGWEDEVLYSFSGESGDTGPASGLTPDRAGSFYGYSEGGEYGSYPAYVFKLAPNGQGGWSKSVVYTFSSGSGGDPQSNLLVDLKGDILGILPYDATVKAGVVFELTPQGNGKWKEVVLHKFKGNPDGLIPTSTALDSAGNVWGMTMAGGEHRCRFYDGGPGCGIAYQLTRGSDGTWDETVLYDFARGGGGVVNPSNGFVLESDGNLFATSYAGGDGVGAVFELRQAQDEWEQKVLYRFAGFSDCFDPMGPLGMNSGGALVGTCSRGGSKGYGTVYELIPTKTGEWTEKILHSFTGRSDGNGPYTGVVIDTHGVVYGTASEGGTGTGCGADGCGTVIEILPDGQ